MGAKYLICIGIAKYMYCMYNVLLNDIMHLAPRPSPRAPSYTGV